MYDDLGNQNLIVVLFNYNTRNIQVKYCTILSITAAFFVTLVPPLSRFSVKRFWIPSTPCTRYADFKLSNINPDSAILCAMKFVIYFPVTNWSNVFLSNSFKCSEHFCLRRISPSFKNGIIRLEAGAYKFLRNQLFMTSMQLLWKRDVSSSAISKMSRSLPRRRENNMRYSAK